MSVNAGNKFTRHMERTKLIVFVATGRTETTLATERNEFQTTTMRAAIHGSSMRRIPTMNHLVDIFNDDRTRLKFIDDMFIIVVKNRL